MPRELRDHLRERLPEYMVPSIFVPLESLPLTPSGKVNRRALPPPRRTRLDGGKDFVPPRDDLEARLAQAWAEVLGVDCVGVRDNFFDLGGHSLLAVRLLARVERLFGVRLPLTTLFQHGTVEHLAGLLRQRSCA